MPSLVTLADWLLIGVVLAISLAFYAYRLAGGADSGPLKTIVRVGDQRMAELSLVTDTTLIVTGKIGEVRIVQRGGELWFEDAPCRLKICERMGHINRSGEVIVCAPGRVMVRLESSAGNGSEGGLDAIAR
ncbi:NusG domain II-containing protein [Gemmatimonadota bacterium]